MSNLQQNISRPSTPRTNDGKTEVEAACTLGLNQLAWKRRGIEDKTRPCVSVVKGVVIHHSCARWKQHSLLYSGKPALKHNEEDVLTET